MTQRDPHRAGSHHQKSTVITIRGARQMLFYEALARERIREAEEEARRSRIVRRLLARRRWARLARYAAERAERARLPA